MFATKPEAILESTFACALVKDAVRQTLNRKGYLTLGEYLRNLSDLDLRALDDLIEEARANAEAGMDASQDSACLNLVLLAVVLANAEGASAADDKEAHEHANFLMMCVTLESLARKGLIKFHRQNATFADMDLPLAEKIDLG